jgi:peptidyl-prolyl cis-trans isomerase SurA
MSILKKLNNISILLSFLLPLFFGPLSVSAMIFDRVVAKVNSEIITLSSVEERAGLLKQKYARASEPPSEKNLLEEALAMIVDEKLQIQEGKKIGFIIDEDSVDAAVEDIKRKNNIAEGQLQEMLELEGRSLESYKNHIRDQIMVSKISRYEIGNRVKVSDKSIVKYYKDHQADLWQDGKVKARHILFIAERGSSEKIRREKLQLAKNVLKEIRKGNDFAELAMQYSEDVSASEGGDVGYVERGKMVPEFEDAVFSLKKDQVSDIVETEYGYHIIKAEEVLLGKTLNLKDSKDRIYQILAMQKQQQAYEDWMKELKESAYIEKTLFEADSENLSPSQNGHENKKAMGRSNKKKLKTNAEVKKQDLQKTWEEMYKSVEKSKKKTESDADSEHGSMEQNLARLKKMRAERTISEKEYQKRKGRLLNRL